MVVNGSYEKESGIKLGITSDVVRDEILNRSKTDDQSFYVCDLDDIVAKIALWDKLYPRIRPFYAVKCNNDELVLKLLALNNYGFDCGSQGEMEQILNIGVSPDRIIFAHTIKLPSHLEFAAKHGITKMTFDNVEELKKIKKYCPTAELVLRLKTDGRNTAFGPSDKFGCDIQDVGTIMAFAKQQQLNLTGVSFHIGCFNSEPINAFKTALKNAHCVCQLGNQFGFSIKLIDIGGGFERKRNCLDKLIPVAEVINDIANKLFPANDGYTIISEPGTFFVRSSFSLFTKIVGKRKYEQESELVNHYYVNDSRFKSFVGFSDAIENDRVRPRAVSLENENGNKVAYLRPSVIWGITCAGDDRIRSRCDLPDLSVGDWIEFEQLGNYSIVCFTLFNGFTQHPKIIHRASRQTRQQLLLK